MEKLSAFRIFVAVSVAYPQNEDQLTTVHLSSVAPRGTAIVT